MEKTEVQPVSEHDNEIVKELQTIGGITFTCNEQHPDRIYVKYDGQIIFFICFKPSYDDYYCCEIVEHYCEYIREVYTKTNRKWYWEGTKEKIRKRVTTIVEEIKTYNISKIKAEYTAYAVKEITIIQMMINKAVNASTAALNLLSNSKPVVEILWDKRKRKWRAFADWKGKRLWCKFPSKFKAEGAFYEVDDLVEQNGCWCVKGKIKALVG